jgi:hypothetical protein
MKMMTVLSIGFFLVACTQNPPTSSQLVDESVLVETRNVASQRDWCLQFGRARNCSFIIATNRLASGARWHACAQPK